MDFESILEGRATPEQLRALRSSGWTVAEMSKRLGVSEHTVRKAMQHDTGIVAVKRRWITGEETKSQRNANDVTPAWFLDAIEKGKNLDFDEIDRHESRRQIKAIQDETARLKKAGATPAVIRLRLKMLSKHRDRRSV